MSPNEPTCVGANTRLKDSATRLLSHHKNASRTRGGIGTIGRDQRIKGRLAPYPEEVAVINCLKGDRLGIAQSCASSKAEVFHTVFLPQIVSNVDKTVLDWPLPYPPEVRAHSERTKAFD